jgi:alkylation response protein AidB-like acyl-CoA dehydrogenase
LDFSLTPELLNLKKRVQEFCEKEFDPTYATVLDRTEQFPRELYQKAAEQGFASLYIPETYGGKGQGYLAACLAMEEMCKADSSLGLACMIGSFGSDLLLMYGTETQKQQLLPPLCMGKTILAAAFTEPSRGTDISTVETTATKTANQWTISGTKTLITNATTADNIIVLCQTGNQNTPRKSQTLFIVNVHADGVSVKQLTNKMGIRCIPTGEITFNNVKAASGYVLGEINSGYDYAMNFFTVSRVLIAAQAVGTAQGALDCALNYAKQRQSYGQPIIRFQQIGAKLAQISAETEAARLLTYKAALLIDQNRVDPMLTSMAKLCASQVAVRATDAAIQTLGGYGYLGDYKVERSYRDARVTEIYEGTSEIQRLAILKQLTKQS